MPIATESQTAADATAGLRRDVAALARQALTDAPTNGGLYARERAAWIDVVTHDALAEAILKRIVVDVENGEVVCDVEKGEVVHT